MFSPMIPDAVSWRNGLVLEPAHFVRTDQRQAAIAHLAGLLADPWPWGFTSLEIHEPALASARLHLDCEGVFPDGSPFGARGLALPLNGRDGEEQRFRVNRDGDGVVLEQNVDAPHATALPVVRLLYHGGVWRQSPDWSAPAFLIDNEHPMRADLNRQLGALAALGAGFMATLRVSGVENRPGARAISQVAAALAQGVGMMEALLASPVVAPGRLGLEALRLTLGVRSAAGIFERLQGAWDPADQRGSVRRLLHEAETTAAGVGLPFRTNVFRLDETGTLIVERIPTGSLVLAIEASRPAGLISARNWFDGAALAAPDRIQEALNRRVAGCTRRPLRSDPRIGVSSGPLLALYRVEADAAWRGTGPQLALAAKTPAPEGTSFSVLIPEDGPDETATALPGALR